MSLVLRSLASHPQGTFELDEKLMVVRSMDMDGNVMDSAVLDAIQVRHFSAISSGGIENVSRRLNAVVEQRDCPNTCSFNFQCTNAGCNGCAKNTEGGHCA